MIVRSVEISIMDSIQSRRKGLTVMENFIIITTYLLVGKALRLLPQFPDETGKVLNLYVIYVSLPALVLLNVPQLSFSTDLVVPILMPWVMLMVSALVVLALSKVFKWNREISGCLLLMIPLGNTSFLGIPMVKAFFGDAGIPFAVLYDNLGSFLALATYGTLVLAFYNRDESRPTAKKIGKKIITFPPFVALLAGVMLRSISYPGIANAILQALASTLVPVVMIAVGFQLTLRLNRQVVAPLCCGLAVKLVAAPLVALVLCKVLGLSGLPVKVAIFEAGMPPMVSAGALAIVADLSPALTAALVGLGIVASFGTLPLLYLLL